VEKKNQSKKTFVALMVFIGYAWPRFDGPIILALFFLIAMFC
jgi:hypothetical protein